jgi:hypothetical protein
MNDMPANRPSQQTLSKKQRSPAGWRSTESNRLDFLALDELGYPPPRLSEDANSIRKQETDIPEQSGLSCFPISVWGDHQWRLYSALSWS